MVGPDGVYGDKRGTRHNQLAGSRDTPGATAARMIRKARDGRRDFVLEDVGGERGYALRYI
jgi:hypothetical protein